MIVRHKNENLRFRVRNAIIWNYLEKWIVRSSQFSTRDWIEVSERVKMKRYPQISQAIGNKGPIFREYSPAKADLQIKYF
jgi:hypothetical protein